MDTTLRDYLLWFLTIAPTHFFKLGLNSLNLMANGTVNEQYLRTLKLPLNILSQLKKPDRQILDQVSHWLEQPQHHLITYLSPEYPPLLKEILNPPVLLFLHGNVTLLKLPQLAMVGTRSPSLMGEATAKYFASIFSQNGLTITSGLATGIDTSSHLGALEHRGSTIGVLGNGIQQTYPRINISLREKILNHNGLIISEFPFNAPPLAWHFPLRNRIICGLSLGTLVIEAKLRSGSLITARLANDCNREVFAIPGSIYSPQSQGCLHLINQGAKLVTTPADVMETLLVNFTPSLIRQPSFQEPYHKTIWQLLTEPLTFEQLLLRTALSRGKLQAYLLEMLNENLIQERTQTYFRALSES